MDEDYTVNHDEEYTVNHDEETSNYDQDYVNNEQEVDVVGENENEYNDNIYAENQQNPMYNSDSEIYAEATNTDVENVDESENDRRTSIKPFKGLTEKLDELGAFGYLCTLGVATLIVFIASIIKVAEKASGIEHDYAIAILVLSSISLASCIALIVLSKVAPETEEKVSPIFSIVLFVLWVGTSGTATFKFPFQNLGNGWVGCWIALFASYVYMTLCFSHFQKIKDTLKQQTNNDIGRQSFGILLGSIICLIASIVTYTHFDCSKISPSVPNIYRECWSSGYGMGISLLSIGFMTAIIILANVCKDNNQMAVNVLAFANTIIWFPSAFILTFYAPFEGAESQGASCASSTASSTQSAFFILNGFVACYVTVIFSIRLFQTRVLPWLRGGCQKGERVVDDDIPEENNYTTDDSYNANTAPVL